MTTKEKITAAAQNLFAAYGYTGTTVDDIVTASGVTKGAFYYYFKTKQSLCEAVINNIENIYRQIFRAFDDEPDEFERLKKTITKFIELTQSTSETGFRAALRISMDIETLEDKARQKKLDLWQWYKNEFSGLVENCRNAGKIETSINSETQVNIITTLLAGMAVNNFCCRCGNCKEAAEYILSKFRYG